MASDQAMASQRNGTYNFTLTTIPNASRARAYPQINQLLIRAPRYATNFLHQDLDGDPLLSEKLNRIGVT